MAFGYDSVKARSARYAHGVLESPYRLAFAACFLLAAPGLGLKAARNSSQGRVLITFFFSSHPRRAIVTP